MSNLQYNLLSGFRTVNTWQQNIMRNAQGLLLPGFNKTTLQFGSTAADTIADSQAATGSGGSRNARMGGGDALLISGQNIQFQQGELRPSDSKTALAISGSGFFMLAENLRPGAKLFLSRSGDFKYDPQGRLVNSQGLFVVGGAGTLTNPPTPVRDPGDGSVVLGDLSLGKVGSSSQLSLSGYGPLVYDLTAAAGPLQTFANGRPEVGFVQGNTLEFPSRAGQLAQITVENTYAQQTYKMFKDFLDNYNRSSDDAIGTVK
jgi:flagellar basal body rod protein FlgG